MNRHEQIANGYDLVHDCYGRFVALIDPNGTVVLHQWYPPTNMAMQKVNHSSETLREVRK